MERDDDDKLNETRAKNAKVGWTSFGANLYLRVDQGADGVTRRRWVCRVTRASRKRDFGCGSLVDTSVRLARRRRDEILETLRRGEDPVAEKREARERAKAAKLATHTFREAAEAVMANREGAWKTGSSSFAAWRKSLFVDCRTLLKVPVSEVGVNDVKAVVAPFWTQGHHVAARGLLTRIETVLGYAIAHEWRNAANVASWSVFEHLTPKRPNGGKRHHAMIPWQEMPAFVAKLRASKDSLSAVALELLALTATRSKEVRGMRFDEIDWDASLWTIPPERMKRSVVFKVPLAAPALRVLKALDESRGKSNLVFPGPQAGKPVANQGLWSQMGRVTGKTATTHGLRASFRSWCSDVGIDDQLAEFCLAHGPKGAVQAAYNRAETVERRREVMTRWADYLDGKASAKVVPYRRGRR
jgi:integrase